MAGGQASSPNESKPHEITAANNNDLSVKRPGLHFNETLPVGPSVSNATNQTMPEPLQETNVSNQTEMAGNETGSRRPFRDGLEKDVILISMSNLEKDENFYEEINRYITTLNKTENLKAEYVELDSDKVNEIFGTRVEKKGDWHEVKRVLKLIIERTGASYVVILGGEGVVPRPSVAASELQCEPTEGDDMVYSDALYIDLNEDDFIDENLSISRFPDYGNKSANIIRELQTATLLHERGGFTISRPAYIMNCMYQPTDCYPSDEYCVSDECTHREELFQVMSSSDYLVFSGHGNPSGFFSTNALHPIFLTSHMEKINLSRNNPVVVGYYSCNTGDLSDETGDIAGVLAVEFMAAGASDFFARTGTFGVPSPVGDNSPDDLKSGKRIGDVLFDDLRDAQEFNCEVTTSALAIVLYGDPTLHIKD